MIQSGMTDMVFSNAYRYSSLKRRQKQLSTRRQQTDLNHMELQFNTAFRIGPINK